MLVVVAYDVSCPRRWRQVYKIIKGFGRRVQYSVFECQLTVSQLRFLQKRLGAAIDPGIDQLRYYRLCEECHARAESIGVPITHREHCFIL